MSLSDLHQNILQPFVDETLTCLVDMASMSAYADEAERESLDQFKFHGFAVAVKTHGSLNGYILMHHYFETALAIGNQVRQALLGISETESKIEEPIIEALEEFSNTAIGLATRHLAEEDHGIQFEPPFFLVAPQDLSKLMQGVVDIITVPVHIENVGRFYLNYLLQEKAGD
ncbi:MAG: chemotaxis protein CheX [Gammaproteobacteria bacterium]|nr:chemotaxis protein CheX [Gammaproteobacteria bacterium]